MRYRKAMCRIAYRLRSNVPSSAFSFHAQRSCFKTVLALTRYMALEHVDAAILTRSHSTIVCKSDVVVDRQYKSM
eukprot:SAG31_NODE_3130_length_4643_cov_264.060079_9_plen_75_part_00